MTSAPRILVVRLGSMGDVIATLPAVASLKHSIPHSKITWVIDPKWSLLLEGNPYVDSVVHLDRRTFAGLRKAWRELRGGTFRPGCGFPRAGEIGAGGHGGAPGAHLRIHCARYARESPASWFYSTKVPIRSYHAVERNLDLAAAAGASNILRTFPLPPGRAGSRDLPDGDFVLASPLAGWGAKQWPLEYYSQLAERLRATAACRWCVDAPYPVLVEGARTHVSAIARPDLCHAQSDRRGGRGQRSAASGGSARQARRRDVRTHGSGAARPLRRNDHRAAKRRRADHLSQNAEPDASMREITPDQVFAALEPILASGRQKHQMSG